MKLATQSVLAAVVALAATSVSNAALVSYFNFNSLAVQGTAAVAPGTNGVPTTFAANQGSGTVSIANFAGLIDDFAGSTINALGGDVAGNSLSLVAGGPTAGPFPGNGSFIDVIFSTTGLEDVVLSFATRGTATGFNASSFSFSIDGGTTFVPTLVPGTATRNTTFALATADFSGVPAIDNQSSVTLRYFVSGASSNAGNNRIDNIQVNATAVIPEPAVLGLVAPAALFLTRRRK